MRLVAPHLRFACRPTALAFLGSLLALANLARLLKEATPPHFGENSVFLDDLLESSQDTLKGLSLFDDDLRHTYPPVVPSCAETRHQRSVD